MSVKPRLNSTYCAPRPRPMIAAEITVSMFSPCRRLRAGFSAPCGLLTNHADRAHAEVLAVDDQTHSHREAEFLPDAVVGHSGPVALAKPRIIDRQLAQLLR